MKKSLGAQTILYPHPVLLVGAYDAEGKANLAPVSWAGICCSRPPCVSVALRPATHTHGCIVSRKAFTVGVPAVRQLPQADFCGIESGRDLDKFEETGLTPVRSELVDAPYAEEVPLVLECELRETHDLGLHTQFVGEILDVKADEDVLTPEGLPDIEKVRPIVYSTGNSSYYAIGERLSAAFTHKEPG